MSTVQPAIDAVFLTANIGEGTFRRVLNSLKSDVRLDGVPIYVIIDSSTVSVTVPEDEDIKGQISLGQVKSPDFESMVTDQLLQRSNTPLTEQKEQMVLRAVSALLNVPPEATKYKVQELEPALKRAMLGYSEQVQEAALRVLARIGSAEAMLEVKEKLPQDDASPELKAQVCRTLASILRRTGAAPSDKVLERLRNVLDHDDSGVRRAAAEAVGSAGLADEELLELKTDYSRLQPAGQ